MNIKSAVKKQKTTVKPSSAKTSLKFKISRVKLKSLKLDRVFVDITQYNNSKSIIKEKYKVYSLKLLFLLNEL